jgi:predicted dithiol-disulfide oxidoreductase (DUF899 family)
MQNEVVNFDEWRTQRINLLKKEKAFTKLRDELSEKRRALPWVRLDKPYIFHTSEGVKSLADLFGDNRQLVVYHFMFGPDNQNPCKMCSFWADNFEGLSAHLNQRDTTFMAISRGQLEKLEAVKQRMGWTFEWISSFKSDFNTDFQVTLIGGETNEYNYKKFELDKDVERPGISVFYKDENGTVYHTYSCYGRELETFNTVYRYLDIVPKGRDEAGLPFTMAWVDYHDRY